jgi:hypothetical protein
VHGGDGQSFLEATAEPAALVQREAEERAPVGVVDDVSYLGEIVAAEGDDGDRRSGGGAAITPPRRWDRSQSAMPTATSSTMTTSAIHSMCVW